ncbi:type II RES/Xre toxin-antitoxin system antitoxin [Rubrivirga litoralis]|uniref:Antitoxin Xre-like helix-turn-helix domain-containing protein n=1 Tax=Rubrivirga litoralis TaxID=3075598 RepID=A0ABU3BQ58_9BACT|nr:antitoxin Xre-like helix-turn-helix domain-containing protein [Rubrivirga sp. F394]MDT0631418.1 antitoxin Xre-like helix-turn-helix domain-containing protein [Rubrivirga sp. F394]
MPVREAFPELGYGVADTVRALRDGLPASRADALASALDLPVSRVAELLGVSASTLSRRRRSGRLGRSESERVYRFGQLVERAAEAFGTMEVGSEWLKRPNWALGREAPIEYADTEPGALQVDRVIGRIEHGIPP